MRKLSGSAVFLACLFWSALVRLPFGLAPRADADAALFWIIGHGWRLGDVPYAGVWDIKPPGIFLIFAGADALFGANPLGGRLLAALAIGIAAAGLYRLCDRVLDDRKAGLIAAALLPPYTLLFDGLAGKPELFCAPLVTWGILLAVEGISAPERRAFGRLILSGVLMGFAATIKQTAVFEIIFVGIALAWIIHHSDQAARPDKPAPTGKIITAWAVYGIGLAAVPLGFALYFAAMGAFADFIDASVVGALLRLRGDGVSLAEAPVRLLASLKTGMPLLVLAGLSWAERRRLAWRGLPHAPFLAWGWLAAAALGELAMRATYPAYALPLVAPLCLLSARLLAAMLRAGTRTWQVAGLAILAGAVCWPILFKAVTPDPDIDRQAPQVAAYLRKAVPGKPVYVVDYDPVIYQLAGAPLLTRFAFHQHMMCDFPALPVSPEEEIRRIVAKRPAALVFAPEKHRMICELPERVDLVRGLAMKAGYREAARIDGPHGAVAIWMLPQN